MDYFENGWNQLKVMNFMTRIDHSSVVTCPVCPNSTELLSVHQAPIPMRRLSLNAFTSEEWYSESIDPLPFDYSAILKTKMSLVPPMKLFQKYWL